MFEKQYKYIYEKISLATNKCIKNIKRAFIKDYQTGRIKATRKSFYKK